MKISVIVPVYNVAKYLENCVNSILVQTYKDFELLLIDDGSTDISGEICDKLSTLDERISVYHKKNGGLSDARNYGIKKSTGELITFIDSDDYISKNYLEVLYVVLKKYKADVSCVSCIETTKLDYNQDITGCDVDGCLDGESAIGNALSRKNIGVSACGKLYKRDLFSDVWFPEGALYEDLFTVPYLFEKCQRVAYSELKLYFYFIRLGSITNSHITEKHLEFFDNYKKLINHLDSKNQINHDAAIERVTIESIKRFAEILLFSDDYYDKVKIVKEKSYKYWKEGMHNPNVALSIKIQVLALMISPVLYKLLFYRYKRNKNSIIGNSYN